MPKGKIDKRKKEIKHRKNFLPTLLVIVLLWAGLFFVVYFIDPYATGALPLFFALIFLALLFTLSILFANTRRGVIGATALTLFLILRYFGVGNIINLLLLLGLAATVEYYFWKHN